MVNTFICHKLTFPVILNELSSVAPDVCFVHLSTWVFRCVVLPDVELAECMQEPVILVESRAFGPQKSARYHQCPTAH